MSEFTEFLQAFVANHNASVGTTLHPLTGPNGAQMWTAGVGGDRLVADVDSIPVREVQEGAVVPARRRRSWHSAATPSRVSWKLWGRSPA
jgi:hypothetical protein